MTISELQNKIFKVLCIVDDICKQNGVCYFLDSGTELGAVREKNFIPWDDDADIFVKSEDYAAFRDAMKAHLPEHMHFIEPQDFSPRFFDCTSRIIDDRWPLRQETPADIAYNNYQNRVGIDVFIYCGCPKSRLGKRMFIIACKMFYGMCIRYRFSIDWKKYSPLEYLQVKTLCALGRIVSGRTPDRALRLRERLMHTFDANKTGWRYSVNVPFNKIYEKPMPNAWFQETARGTIRDRQFPIVAAYDKKLTLIYGDYMTPERDPKKYLTHM